MPSGGRGSARCSSPCFCVRGGSCRPSSSSTSSRATTRRRPRRRRSRTRSSALRKALGPDVLVTRPPGYALADRARAARLPALRAAARGRAHGRRPSERARARSPGARAVARACPRRVRVRGLGPDRDRGSTSCASSRSRSGSRRYRARPPGRLVAELESLVAEQPLRERLWYLLMWPAPAGRSAEALQAYQDARRALVDELGIEPGEALRALQGEILRGEATLARSNGRRRRSRTPTEVVKALLAGRRRPCARLDGGADLAAQLARRSATRATGRPTWRGSRSTSRR